MDHRARVFGHFSNLSFSLLLLPAARNSMWVSAFGIPFERAIKYHRMMGAIAYMCVTVHMMIWFIKVRARLLSPTLSVPLAQLLPQLLCDDFMGDTLWSHSTLRHTCVCVRVYALYVRSGRTKDFFGTTCSPSTT
jgi:hypothetical protein